MKRRHLLAGALVLPAVLNSGTLRAAERPQLLEFWASWCGICRDMEPTMAALRQKWGERIAIRIIDVDDPKNAALVRQYKVLGTATFVLLDAQGREVFRNSGRIPSAVFEDQFKKLLQA